MSSQQRLFGHDNDGRKLTLEIVIVDGRKAGWIWESVCGESAHGVQVTSISEERYRGDILECDCGTLWKPEMTGAKSCPDCDTWVDR